MTARTCGGRTHRADVGKMTVSGKRSFSPSAVCSVFAVMVSLTVLLPSVVIAAGFEAGITVITHGFQADGSFPAWPVELARNIATQAGASRFYKHDPATGDWLSMPTDPLAQGAPDPAKEIVLVYDWALESNDVGPTDVRGWSEAAGDNLFASLADLPDELGDVRLIDKKLHMIGHSRGALVNQAATARLGTYFPDYLVDHVTTLDPHPVQRGTLLLPSDADPVPVVYANVRYADNYWRSDGILEPGDFDGEIVPGAHNVRLSEDVLSGAGSVLEHSDVHIWYGATVDSTLNQIEGFTIGPGPEEIPSTWWDHEPNGALRSTEEPKQGRAHVGFSRSRIGGAPELATAVTSKTNIPENIDSVFNGDFRFSNFGGDDIPGWERHAGGGTGHVDGSSDWLELDRGNHERTHNPLYFPPDATRLQFDYRVTDDRTDDFFSVSIEGTNFLTGPLAACQSDVCGLRGTETRGFVTHSVPIPAMFRGRTAKLRFAISPVGSVDSEIQIDNIAFIRQPLAIVGDIDRDGIVGFADFLLLSSRFGQAVSPSGCCGDINGDGEVAFVDFLILSANFGRPDQFAAVPEPCTPWPLACAGYLLASRRRWRPAAGCGSSGQIRRSRRLELG